MSLDEHVLITDARMTVGAVRVGTLSHEHFAQYLALLRGFDRFSAAQLRCVAHPGQRQTPFSKRSRGEWGGGAGPQVHLRWVESPSAVDQWADLQPSKEVIGVVGVCRSEDVASLTAAHRELREAVGAHRFARHGDCYRLYVFDPSTDGTPESAGEAELPNVILIPAATARMSRADYLHRLLEDLVSDMVEKLDEWVLDLDGNMPVLQTALDTRSIEESQLVAKRRSGRMSKYMGDCALMSGSPRDALELYAAAAQDCKAGRDKLWYASALEGQCCAELVEHALQQPPMDTPGIEQREKPRPVDRVRERMIEALDIYSLSRLPILENECCLKFAQFLVDVYRHEGVRWIWLMDSLRWAVDFSQDLPVELRLRVLEKVQSLYGALGCRRKVAFFMQLRARLLSDELRQTGLAGAIYVDLINYYVHASDTEGVTPAHRRCLTQRVSECNWPALEQVLYRWLSEIAKRQGNPAGGAIWDLQALVSPALLARCRSAKQLESELALVTSRLAVAEAEGTTLGRGRQEDIDRLKSQAASLQTSLEASHQQASEQAAMAQAVERGFGLFPPSCQGKQVRPQILVRIDALELSAAVRPVLLHNAKADHGPFLYSSFMARDAAKKWKPILWASGEVATVSAQLRNPLSIPIQVVDATLVVSDPFFDASPQSFTLDAGATRSLWLSGVCSPGTAGGGKLSEQKVLGISMTVFGVVHQYPVDAGGHYVHREGFMDVDTMAEPEPEPESLSSNATNSTPLLGDVKGLGLDVTVVPPMPKLVARLHGCTAAGDVLLKVGEEKELQLSLANTSGGRCAAANISLSQRALRLDGSPLYKAKTKKQIAAEGHVDTPGPITWSEADLAAATPLPAGHTVTVPLRVRGIRGCAAVALTVAYDGGAEASYGRELPLAGVRLTLQNDGPAEHGTSLVVGEAEGPQLDTVVDGFRWELAIVPPLHGQGAPRSTATSESLPACVEPLPEAGSSYPCERRQWQISSFTFYELRLCVAIPSLSVGKKHSVGESGQSQASGPIMSVHLDATGMDGCSCSGAFDYEIAERQTGDTAGGTEGDHIHRIGLFFTKPTLAQMTVGVTDHSTGQVRSHRCDLAVS